MMVHVMTSFSGDQLPRGVGRLFFCAKRVCTARNILVFFPQPRILYCAISKVRYT
jgi:hypothetical protein